MLFKTIAIGEKSPQYVTELNSKYSMGKWEFRAMERGGDQKMKNY